MVASIGMMDGLLERIEPRPHNRPAQVKQLAVAIANTRRRLDHTEDPQERARLLERYKRQTQNFNNICEHL